MSGVVPSGTVTFLFTDVEGSTRAWEEHPGEMSSALARHDEILRQAIDAHGGYVFSTAGDAFSAAFSRVGDGVAAAVGAQAALVVERWPDPVEIRVRMGLHTGEADERDGDYFGSVVNRAARVMDAGHGGQLLISDVTRTLATDVETVDLGEHLLKSLDEPIRLHQVAVPGSPGPFPPVRSAGSKSSTIRPARTELIGRTSEVAKVLDLVGSQRLVTLTGAGGSGKTRLALEVGNLLVPSMSGGVFFVDLGKVSDERLVASSFAEGVGLSIDDNLPAAEVLHGYLAAREALLVVDNCEHLIDDVAQTIDDLMAVCLEVRILATSREPLEVDGERTVRLGGLDDREAVELFNARRGRIDNDGRTNDEPDVIEICRRLDGLPLAIELAAARATVLSTAEIRAHLDNRFALLTGGRRRTRGRQQTLKTTVQWSYDLLDPTEQKALRALSVMPSTFGLDLAAALLDGSPVHAAEVLDGLVARSLVQSDTEADEHGRYWLLETIRVFAGDELRESGEDDETRNRHANAVLHLLGAESLRGAQIATADQAGLADDALAAMDWARALDDHHLGCHLTAVAIDVLLDRGAVERANDIHEWATTIDDAELRAAIWSIGAWIGIWTSDMARTVRCADRAIAEAPEALGTLWCRIHRANALAVHQPDVALAAIELVQEHDLVRADADVGAYAGFIGGAAALYVGDTARAVGELEHAQSLDSVFESLTRNMLIVALIAAGDIDGLQALHDRPRRADRFLHAALAPYAFLAGEAMALAHLGRVVEARRLVATLWDQRPPHASPADDTQVLVALAESTHVLGEVEATQALLRATHFAGRSHHTAYLIYFRSAEYAAVPEPDRLAWMQTEVLRRLSDESAEDRSGLAVAAVESELTRIGLR